jgi:hypothetical protein
MKKKLLFIGLAIGMVACSEAGTVEENNTDAQEELTQEDEVEDLGYTLGPDSDIPLVDMYGEDSLDADGNFVYPSRDTIWH